MNRRDKNHRMSVIVERMQEETCVERMQEETCVE